MWADAYQGCSVQPPDCSWNDTSITGTTACGHPTLAAVYFLSFNIFGSLILINLFIAVILEMFTQGVDSQRQEKLLESVNVWKSFWEDEDERREGIIDVQKFIHTLLRAPKPAGLSTFENAMQLREAYLRGRKLVRRKTSWGRALNASDGKDDIYQLPSFSSVIRHFQKIKLLVHKKAESDGKRDSWYVVYEECVIALGTMIVGPNIEAPVQHPGREMSFVDWYKKYFEVKTEFLEKSGIKTDEEKYNSGGCAR